MTDGIEAAFALLNPQAPPEVAAEQVTTAEPGPEVQALQNDLEAAKAEAAKVRQQLHRQALQGKVSDVDLALKVLDPEKHLDADGNVKIDALTREFAGLLPAVRYPTSPDGAGGTHPSFTGGLEGALRSGSPGLINYEFDQQLNRK
ncbi:hypothetical protein [Deinococcus sp. PEB2-63]